MCEHISIYLHLNKLCVKRHLIYISYIYFYTHNQYTTEAVIVSFGLVSINMHNMFTVLLRSRLRSE